MALGNKGQRVFIDIDSINVEKSYKGPSIEKIEDITSDWIEELMQWQKDRKVLHKKYACMIINKAREYFEAEKSLVDVIIG